MGGFWLGRRGWWIRRTGQGEALPEECSEESFLEGNCYWDQTPSFGLQGNIIAYLWRYLRPNHIVTTAHLHAVMYLLVMCRSSRMAFGPETREVAGPKQEVA